MEKRIIFHPLLSARFEDFGLSIPIEDDRAKKVVDNLSVKIPHVDMNLITPLTKNDLKNVHSIEFVNDFFNSTFQEMIYNTYDLQNYPETKAIQYDEFRKHLLIQGGASFFGLSRMLEDDFAMFLGGGMHHARYESGHGFCPYHDFLSAYFKLGLNAKDLIVIDIDAHQGDGTADIGNRLGVKTISFHMKSGWPLTDPKIKKINSTI
ncbi:hypothetical protein OAT67_09170, partial [Bacteriovoracaceae bacterium]|nr:hypothetical protein [Bacteriovoracaceae bacterium]